MALYTSNTITFDYKGYTTTETIVCGNRYENLVRDLAFSFPDVCSSLHKYFIASLQTDSGLKIVVLPISSNKVSITKAITKYAGSWKCCVICREKEISFSDETIDIEPLLSEAQWVSSSFTGTVNDNGISKTSLPNYTIESNT